MKPSPPPPPPPPPEIQRGASGLAPPRESGASRKTAKRPAASGESERAQDGQAAPPPPESRASRKTAKQRPAASESPERAKTAKKARPPRKSGASRKTAGLRPGASVSGRWATPADPGFIRALRSAVSDIPREEGLHKPGADGQEAPDRRERPPGGRLPAQRTPGLPRPGQRKVVRVTGGGERTPGRPLASPSGDDAGALRGGSR